MVLINSEVDLKIKKFDDQSHMHLYVVRGAHFTTSDNPARSPGEPVYFVFRSVEHNCRVDKRPINARQLLQGKQVARRTLCCHI